MQVAADQGKLSTLMSVLYIHYCTQTVGQGAEVRPRQIADPKDRFTLKPGDGQRRSGGVCSYTYPGSHSFKALSAAYLPALFRYPLQPARDAFLASSQASARCIIGQIMTR